MRRTPLDTIQIMTLLLFVAALGYLAWLGYGALPEPTPTPQPSHWFDQEKALVFAQSQCDFGPRPSGSPAAWRTGTWIQEQLEAQDWNVTTQEFSRGDLPARNIIARKGEGPLVLIISPYVTAPSSSRDSDPRQRNQPEPGASTAAAVAVLLELGQVLDVDQLQNEVWLVFLDGAAGEDRLGLQTFLTKMEQPPLAAIQLDFLATTRHPLVIAPGSDPTLTATWLDLAQTLGFRGRFAEGSDTDSWPSVLSSYATVHISALELAEPGYPYWRTTEDTCDKLQARSFAAPGQMLESLLEQNWLLSLSTTPSPQP
ncbi:MAG: hypothetical protein GXP38_09715 [Chloroflexi bacterium]|nr:hypothetical protein [Chloroflexota bacterium]